ncbi:hypothetical protein MK079_04810, partial [Candidatus Gracilibacteria bacterium]|nr:hypothetical protein [Candidatus Gracilibacteria bacterium]
LSHMKDAEIDQVLKENHLQRLPEPNDRFMTPNEQKLEAEYDKWWGEVYYSPELSQVRKVVDLIGRGSDKDLFIGDRNPGNIMKTTDGITYLIDFGYLEK